MWFSLESRLAPPQLPQGRTLRVTSSNRSLRVSIPLEAANSRRSTYEHLGISTGGIVIIFGLILLLIGFVTGIAIVWTIGIIVLLVGLALWILGSLGHAVGGRHHYY
jgi:fatty-acid desaturase